MALSVQDTHPAGAARQAIDLLGRRPVVWLALLLAVLVLLPLVAAAQSYLLQLLMSVFLFAVLGQAWNLTAGYAGLLNFGQQAFIGLGGFALALVHYYGGVPIWLAWPVSGLAALALAALLCLPIKARKSKRRVWIGVGVAIVAWIAYEGVIAVEPAADVFQSAYVRRTGLLLLIFLGALPVLRLRGPYFAIATWLIAEAVGSLFNVWSVTGAGGGMQIKSDVTQMQLYYVALLLLIATTVFIWLWMRSTQGLALTAIRDDEDAAQSCGVDVNTVKALVYVSSAAMTGLAAGLYFIDVVIITPTSGFTISWAAYIVFIVVAGGMGTVAGPIIGAVVFIIVERVLGAAAGQGLLVLGVLSILLMLLLPRGIMGLLGDLRRTLGPSPPARARINEATGRQIA